MSRLSDVLKLAKKQNYTILLGEKGSSKFCVVPVDKEHIPDMPQRLEDQLKAEGKLGYYVGIIMPTTWEPCMDVLPIYGRTDKYETKWLCKYIEDAIDDELQDRGTKLYKRILAYEPNVAAMKSKTESIEKLHINEAIELDDNEFGREYLIQRITLLVEKAMERNFEKLADIFYYLDIEPDESDDVSSEEFYSSFSDFELSKLYAHLLDIFEIQNLEDFFWYLEYDNGRYTDGSYSKEALDLVKYLCKLINKEYNLKLPTNF